MSEDKHETHTQDDIAAPADMHIDAPWERVFDRVMSPFDEFIHNASSGGIVLMLFTVFALVIGNSALADEFAHLLHIEVGFTFGSWMLHMSVHHWINDALMALFFFVVGLEIKREVLVGELSDLRQAALPSIAALGGMLVPALIYYSLNLEGDAARGWGIPMATDIAFAVGAIVLLGRRVPKSLITFLVALAIVDDLGAVVVIALFYTDELVPEVLAAALVLLGVLIAFNRFGIRRPLPYFLIGSLLWLALLKSGVHATIAGVLTALTIPARPRYEPRRFSNHVQRLLERYDMTFSDDKSILTNPKALSVLSTLERGIQRVQTPLHRLERSLHMPVAFIIIPIFALANAAIPIPFASLGSALGEPVTFGVALGLVLGKLIGITGVSWLAVKLGIGSLPPGTHFGHIFGAGLLAGIGFTMSIFIAELGFLHQPDFLLQAKTGVLFASLLAGISGYLWLRWVGDRTAAG